MNCGKWLRVGENVDRRKCLLGKSYLNFHGKFYGRHRQTLNNRISRSRREGQRERGIIAWADWGEGEERRAEIWSENSTSKGQTISIFINLQPLSLPLNAFFLQRRNRKTLQKSPSPSLPYGFFFFPSSFIRWKLGHSVDSAESVRSTQSASSSPLSKFWSSSMHMNFLYRP